MEKKWADGGTHHKRQLSQDLHRPSECQLWLLCPDRRIQKYKQLVSSISSCGSMYHCASTLLKFYHVLGHTRFINDDGNKDWYTNNNVTTSIFYNMSSHATARSLNIVTLSELMTREAIFAVYSQKKHSKVHVCTNYFKFFEFLVTHTRLSPGGS